ncbi:MAG: hypothetical protein QM729_01455 [Solirubrobacterales bacterium]
MRRTKASLAAFAVALATLAVFASTAAATFEATMVTRQTSARASGPTFIVEAGGGRRTRIRNLSVESGACGSIYAPLVDAGRVKAGFPNGNGSAIFSLNAQHLHLRIELKVSPRGEGLRGRGVLKATVGECHEKVPMDLVSSEIRGGGRHT